MRYVMLVLRAGAGAGLFAVDRHRDPFEHFFVFSGPHTGGGPLKIRPNESPAYGLLRVERARQRLRPPLQPPHHPCPGLPPHRRIRSQRAGFRSSAKLAGSKRYSCVYSELLRISQDSGCDKLLNCFRR
jgi:hypothetical protein